jgi:mono/diheme cytochrome c family protein
VSTRARRVWTGLGVLVLAGLVVVAAIVFWPAPAPPNVAAQPVSPALIARGAYVATAADCIACHTAKGGQPYAGGRAFRLPFGTIYAPNITPDPATGIGAWTDGQFLRAVHKGVGRQGEPLYPAFPYTSYARMTDADALAVKAYLFSLQPVSHQVRKNALVFPFNQRRLVRFWNILFLRGGDFQAEADKPADWNRGRYLVTVLGHCGECHTPRNLLYGPSGAALSGETMQGWTAWNITSDRRHGVGDWSPEEIAAYLRTGYAPGRGVASGPMKEAVDYSLSRISEGDRRAIAIYLKDVPGSANGPEPAMAPHSMTGASFTGPAPGELGQDPGLRIFEGACASCHAWNGRGQQSPAAALAGRRSTHDAAATNVVQTVLRGGDVTTPDGHAFMPAFATSYSDAEIAAVSNFVVRHFGGIEGRATPKTVAGARAE